MGMGARAVHVGRIGGLAVALGIGAALFTGHGVASANPPNASGSSSDSSKTNVESKPRRSRGPRIYRM
jgi:hypothetical protein